MTSLGCHTGGDVAVPYELGSLLLDLPHGVSKTGRCQQMAVRETESEN